MTVKVFLEVSFFDILATNLVLRDHLNYGKKCSSLRVDQCELNPDYEVRNIVKRFLFSIGRAADQNNL